MYGALPNVNFRRSEHFLVCDSARDYAPNIEAYFPFLIGTVDSIMFDILQPPLNALTYII